MCFYTNGFRNVLRHGSILRRRHQTAWSENLHIMQYARDNGSNRNQLLHHFRCCKQSTCVEHIRLHFLQEQIGGEESDGGLLDVSLLQCVRHHRDVVRTFDAVGELGINKAPRSHLQLATDFKRGSRNIAVELDGNVALFGCARIRHIQNRANRLRWRIELRDEWLIFKQMYDFLFDSRGEAANSSKKRRGSIELRRFHCTSHMECARNANILSRKNV